MLWWSAFAAYAVSSLCPCVRVGIMMSQPTLVGGLAPRTAIAPMCPNQARKKPRAEERTSGLKQMSLDFGQRNVGPDTCNRCGMVYSHTREDIAAHAKFCTAQAAITATPDSIRAVATSVGASAMGSVKQRKWACTTGNTTVYCGAAAESRAVLLESISSLLSLIRGDGAVAGGEYLAPTSCDELLAFAGGNLDVAVSVAKVGNRSICNAVCFYSVQNTSVPIAMSAADAQPASTHDSDDDDEPRPHAPSNSFTASSVTFAKSPVAIVDLWVLESPPPAQRNIESFFSLQKNPLAAWPTPFEAVTTVVKAVCDNAVYGCTLSCASLSFARHLLDRAAHQGSVVPPAIEAAVGTTQTPLVWFGPAPTA